MLQLKVGVLLDNRILIEMLDMLDHIVFPSRRGLRVKKTTTENSAKSENSNPCRVPGEWGLYYNMYLRLLKLLLCFLLFIT